MSAKDRPVSKPATQAFRDNYDAIFKKKDVARSGGCPTCTYTDCLVRDESDTYACPSHSSGVKE